MTNNLTCTINSRNSTTDLMERNFEAYASGDFSPAGRLMKSDQSHPCLRKTGDPRVLDGDDVYDTYSRIRKFPPPK